MLPEYRAFWVRGEDGGEYGPVGLRELREWVRENRAGLGTEVRSDETDSLWQPWQYYPELVALLAEVHVTSPVPGQPGLVLAPMGRRVLAFGMDIILGWLLSMPILFVLLVVYIPDLFIQFAHAMGVHSQVMPEVPVEDQIIRDLIVITIQAIYFTGFQAIHGRTPGKSCAGIKVVDENGQKPSLAKCFIRAFFMIISIQLIFIPFFYAFFNPQRRAFHDLIAGTYVVKR